jgi:trk system potassium uptake protein TrkH
MQVSGQNKKLEYCLIGLNVLASAVVVATFVMLFGLEKPLLPASFLYLVQILLLFVFIGSMGIRLFNAVSKAEYLRANWFEIPLLIALAATVLGAEYWFGQTPPATVRHFAVGLYLVLQVIIRVCKAGVTVIASGKSPSRTLIATFLILIVTGTGFLTLPRAAAGERIGLVDALFTSTSAVCVTGLIVKDTGSDFSFMGQLVILALIQLGGLGIVVFGAVFAVLLGQALSLRGSVAMQDLLSTQTVSQIGKMMAFIFVGTLLIEATGAVAMFGMWDDAAGWTGSTHEQWFCSIFHSISAFCNAGFSLFSKSFIHYNRSWTIYAVICPLIVLGGLGFSVLYNLVNISADRIKRFFKRSFNKQYRISMEAPRRMRLQTKIVLSVSACLILLGMLAMLLFEHHTERGGNPQTIGVLDALFQSVTARTAGFNTVNIAQLSASSKLILILLMFVGGSPGSTAGGIKTVTLAVIAMTVIAALRKREEVEMFGRSIRIAVVGRAITVTMLFVVVLFGAALALSITEKANDFALSDILFETGSALGTVGLTTGITPSLTTAGKLIIIAVMLIGRLGPLTLLAALTFNLKPAHYSYPDEPIIVG